MAQTTSLIVIDDFYSNPMEVRTFALNQKFNISGNFPGFRTKSLLNDTIKGAIQYIINPIQSVRAIIVSLIDLSDFSIKNEKAEYSTIV